MSEPDLNEVKRLMCEWLEKFYNQPNGIRYQHCRGMTRVRGPGSRSPGYEPDGREAIIFHNCGDVAGLAGLLRESGGLV